MSWSGLASNQIVSNTNLNDACSTGVFVAKTTIPTTNRELTATAAVGYAYVTVSGGVANNQLVQKSDLTSYVVGPGPYNYYVYATDPNHAYRSTDGGWTFTTCGLPSSNTYSSIAGTNQYVVVGSPNTNGVVYVSNDSGVSFTTVTISNLIGYSFSSFYPYDIDMSATGKYVAVVGKEAGGTSFGRITVAISSDFGVSFRAYQTAYYSGTGNKCAVAVSSDGSRISYVATNFGTGSVNSWRYYSNDYGATFSSGGLSTNQYLSDISMNLTGGNQLIVNYGDGSTFGGGNFYVSYDYGATFYDNTPIPMGTNNNGGIQCGMTTDGVVMTILSTAYGGLIWYSTNYGSYGSWSYYTGNVSSSNVKGIAIGVLNSSSSNYLAYIPANYCDYKPIGTTTFYPLPNLTTFSMNKIYRKARNY
jgi:hypothetical protein